MPSGRRVAGKQTAAPKVMQKAVPPAPAKLDMSGGGGAEADLSQALETERALLGEYKKAQE
eukprot:4149420-Lingulodinium_polyedra.AAC.1